MFKPSDAFAILIFLAVVALICTGAGVAIGDMYRTHTPQPPTCKGTIQNAPKPETPDTTFKKRT